MGLLLLALIVARPGVLGALIRFDVSLWASMPWVPPDWFEEEGRYQRTYRRVLVSMMVAWTLVNLALFALGYVIPI
jgi:hypothetical protein